MTVDVEAPNERAAINKAKLIGAQYHNVSQRCVHATVQKITAHTEAVATTTEDGETFYLAESVTFTTTLEVYVGHRCGDEYNCVMGPPDA